MDHIKALLLKAVATFLLLVVVLGFLFQYSYNVILGLTLILGFVSYILGDLMLLPRTSNVTATISDFAVAMLITWFYLANISTVANNVFLASLFTAIGVTLFEIFFHRYMKKNVLPQEDIYSPSRIGYLRYNAEMSEEISIDRKRIKDE